MCRLGVALRLVPLGRRSVEPARPVVLAAGRAGGGKPGGSVQATTAPRAGVVVPGQPKIEAPAQPEAVPAAEALGRGVIHRNSLKVGGVRPPGCGLVLEHRDLHSGSRAPAARGQEVNGWNARFARTVLIGRTELEAVQRKRDRSRAGKYGLDQLSQFHPEAGGGREGPIEAAGRRFEHRSGSRRVERGPAPYHRDVDGGGALVVHRRAGRCHRFRKPGGLEARGARLKGVDVERRHGVEIPEIVPNSPIDKDERHPGIAQGTLGAVGPGRGEAAESRAGAHRVRAQDDRRPRGQGLTPFATDLGLHDRPNQRVGIAHQGRHAGYEGIKGNATPEGGVALRDRYGVDAQLPGRTPVPGSLDPASRP